MDELHDSFYHGFQCAGDFTMGEVGVGRGIKWGDVLWILVGLMMTLVIIKESYWVVFRFRRVIRDLTFVYVCPIPASNTDLVAAQVEKPGNITEESVKG